MKKALLISALTLGLACPGFAQQTKILTADKGNDYGLVYSLPDTGLLITVTAKRTVYLAGPYAKYAKKYLATDKVISEGYEEWTITDVTVDRYGAVNPESQYIMTVKPGSQTFIAVNQDGMIQTINRKPAENIGDTLYRPAEQIPSEAIPTGKEYLQFVDEDFIASQSSAKQAEMLAANIMEVRDARLSLTRGTADTMPTDGRQLELMLNSLNKQEQDMTAAFTGNSYSETVTRTFTFVPEDDTTMTLFRFSDFKGFCSANDYAGSPFTVRVNVTARGSLPVDANGKEKEIPKDGVRYTIPGSAQITLTHDNNTYYNRELEFGQMGIVFGLNPNLFTDKKNPSYAIFNPITGGLLELGN